MSNNLVGSSVVVENEYSSSNSSIETHTVPPLIPTSVENIQIVLIPDCISNTTTSTTAQTKMDSIPPVVPVVTSSTNIKNEVAASVLSTTSSILSKVESESLDPGT
jgi:hypothetical protein